MGGGTSYRGASKKESIRGPSLVQPKNWKNKGKSPAKNREEKMKRPSNKKWRNGDHLHQLLSRKKERRVAKSKRRESQGPFLGKKKVKVNKGPVRTGGKPRKTSSRRPVRRKRLCGKKGGAPILGGKGVTVRRNPLSKSYAKEVSRIDDKAREG